VEISAEQFAFRHALTQQAVYTGLLARERRLLHRALAEAMEQLYATTPIFDAHLEDLAFHYYEAGVWEKALEYERRVGKRRWRYTRHARLRIISLMRSPLSSTSLERSLQKSIACADKPMKHLVSLNTR
jgi:hypothetical protein